MNLKKIGIVSLSLFLSLGTLGVIAGSLPFAEAQENQAFERSIDERLDQLTESVAQLVEAVSQTVDVSEVPAGIDPATGLPEGAEYRNGVYYNYHYLNQSASECVNGWQEWPSSRYYKQDAEWDLSGIIQYTSPHGTSQFVDINGDGLNDYIFHNHRNGAGAYGSSSDPNNPSDMYIYRTGPSCVAINNGKGFDVVYRCITALDQNTPDPITGLRMTITHYGDCADTSAQ